MRGHKIFVFVFWNYVRESFRLDCYHSTHFERSQVALNTMMGPKKLEDTKKKAKTNTVRNIFSTFWVCITRSVLIKTFTNLDSKD